MFQQLTLRNFGATMVPGRRTLMSFSRFLIISLLTSASIAPLTAQTKQQIKQLPRGCAYMRLPVLESPFPYPAQKDAINLTRVVAPPQFLVHSLPSPAKSFLNPMPLFAEPPSGFIMVCGLHSGNAALKQHDYPTAQTSDRMLVKEDLNSFGYVYPLALAYLNADPPDSPRGLFYIARAAALAGVDDRKKLEDYGREQYEKYHGSAEGWSEVLRLAKANPHLPSGFTITAATSK